MYTGQFQYNGNVRLQNSRPNNNVSFNPGSKPTSGSTVYEITGNSLQDSQSQQGLFKSSASSAVPVVFPKVDTNWFYQGYPQTVDAGTAAGSLIEYVPVSFYARRSGRVDIGMNPIDIYVGYINTDGNYVSTVDIHRNFNQGDFVFAILLNKYAGAANGTKINNFSYWTLLSEVSNIQPGQEVTKQVSVTSGVTTQESKTFATTVGSTVGFKAGFEGSEISASLSISLSQSFSSSISVTTQQTVTDSITFPSQDKVQRDAIYQFVERYNIIPGGPLMGWRDYLNGTSTDEAKFFSNQFVCSVEQAPPFDYPSRYYATSFVLDPS